MSAHATSGAPYVVKPSSSPKAPITPTLTKNVLAVVLACVCVWCASGVVAIEFASLIKSGLSPWLLSLKDQVTMPCVAALLVVSPVSHVTGRSTVSGYKMWQPFRGGSRFIIAQAAGWSFWSAGSILVALDVMSKLNVPGSPSLPCFRCAPGFLLGVVACMVIGNTALLSSLYLFSSSPPSHKKRTTATLVAAACTSAVALMAAVMVASHPALAPHLTSTSASSSLLLALPSAASLVTGTLAFVWRHLFVASGFGLVAVLNRYPIQLPPSPSLDFFGRINNLYQIIAHVGVALKFLGYSPQIYGSLDEQHPMDFQIMNVLDYAGWVAIFSRLDHVPLLPKTLANTHMATGMLSLLAHQRFQGQLIVNTLPAWDWFRATFVLTDAVVRSYYHFFVLGNV